MEMINKLSEVFQAERSEVVIFCHGKDLMRLNYELSKMKSEIFGTFNISNDKATELGFISVKMKGITYYFADKMRMGEICDKLSRKRKTLKTEI